MPYIMNRC